MKPGGRKCTAGSSWSWKTAAVKKLLARSEAGALRYYSPSDKLGSLRASVAEDQAQAKVRRTVNSTQNSDKQRAFGNEAPKPQFRACPQIFGASLQPSDPAGLLFHSRKSLDPLVSLSSIFLPRRLRPPLDLPATPRPPLLPVLRAPCLVLRLDPSPYARRSVRASLCPESSHLAQRPGPRLDA
jgi:hypothetical protein